MKESALNATIRTNMKKIPGVFCKRIENTCEAGTPDLYLRYRGCSAWVENKLVREWPKRSTTVVVIPHYTAEQRLWLREHGPGSWLFVQVGKEYFLFDHVAAQDVGRMFTQRDFYDYAAASWQGRCDWGEWLLDIITRG